MSLEILAVGVNHKGAPVELRERLAVGDDQLSSLLRALREHGGLHEAMIVSTSAATARPMSSGEAYSAGLWLIPPRQRTKIIPIGPR